MSICRFVVLSITSLRCIQAFSIPTLCILAEIWWCRKDRLMFSFASEPKTTKRWCLNPSCCWFQSQPLSLQQRHRIFPRDIINLAVMQLCYIETHETSLDFLSASLTYCQNVWDIMIQTHTHTWYVTQTGILPSTVVFESVFLVTSVTWPTLVAWEHVTSKINFEGEAIRVFELFYLGWSPLPVTVTWIIPFFVGFPINLHLWLILGRGKTQVLPVVYKESRHFVCSKNVSPKKAARFLRKPQSPETPEAPSTEKSASARFVVTFGGQRIWAHQWQRSSFNRLWGLVTRDLERLTS